MPLKYKPEPKNLKELPASDEQAFRKARADHEKSLKETARLEAEIAANPISSEPCCGNCKKWIGPKEAGKFGECRFLVVVRRRSPQTDLEVGNVIGRNDPRIMLVEYEPLRTRAPFEGCSAYARKRDEVAA